MYWGEAAHATPWHVCRNSASAAARKKERCHKRAAEETAEYLRRIFDTESQSVGNAAASTVAFGEIERRLLPLLPILMLVMLLRESQEHVTKCAMANSFFSDLWTLLMKVQRVYLHQIHSSIFCRPLLHSWYFLLIVYLCTVDNTAAPKVQVPENAGMKMGSMKLRDSCGWKM